VLYLLRNRDIWLEGMTGLAFAKQTHWDEFLAVL
jgi:hypothetical protein